MSRRKLSNESKLLHRLLDRGLCPTLADIEAAQVQAQPEPARNVQPQVELPDPNEAEASLAAFIKQAWHVIEPVTVLQWGWHLDAIADHLMAVALGQIQNLLITIPPGCTKSISVCVMFPVWTWINSPSTRFLCAANSDELVIRDAVASRRLIQSDWFQERWGSKFQMTSDQNVKSWYENDRRGYRTSTTTGATVSGKKGDILIVDDPNDAKKVASPAERLRINSWWDQAFYNRVNNEITGQRIVIGQRTHYDDLIGHIKRTSTDFVELRIPEEFNPGKRCTTPIGWTDPREETGELLRPARFGPKQIKSAKKRLGSAGYAAQHGQDPLQEQGVHFKPHWFRTFRLSAARDTYHFLDGSYIAASECLHFAIIDPATGKGPNSDATAIVVFAVTPRGQLLILDAVSRIIPLPELTGEVGRIIKAWRPEYIACEANGFQIEVARKIREVNRITVREIDPEGKSKLVRATKAIIMAEAGDVLLNAGDPNSGPPDWMETLIEQLTQFTGTVEGETDDLVDCVAYGAKEAEAFLFDPGEPLILGTAPGRW